MSKTVIKVENLSKQYRLGQVGTGTISHDLNRWWHRVRGKEDPYLKIGETNDRASKGQSEYVWALKDINFEVQQGEVLGIIGKNGAGKSTLLKILSKVTGPTTGSIKAKGRIASLLEVGTGFHPELTGRENIFLNGTILGMTKAEVKAKLDEIVAFAGVERYLDTPVKRYSSGMMVRLGFAVAAHLEPEILIVDEVLAVGDAEFQKKAIGKMQEVSTQGGRTVLFVSHNMGSVANLCSNSMLLVNGKLEALGATKEIIDYYLDSSRRDSSYIFNQANHKKQKRDGNYIARMQMVNTNGDDTNTYLTTQEVLLKLSAKISKPLHGLEIGLSLMDKTQHRIFTILEKVHDFVNEGKDVINLQFKLPSKFLTPGYYSWIAVIHLPNVSIFHELNDVCGFTVADGGTEFSAFANAFYGNVFPSYQVKTY